MKNESVPKSVSKVSVDATRESGKTSSINRGHKMAGASLAEFLMYMGLAVMVVVGATNWYNQSSDSSDVTSTVQSLTMLTVNIRSSYEEQGIYTGLDNSGVLSSMVPESMRIPGNNSLIRSKYATDGVEIVPRNVGGVDDDGFGITFKTVPLRACNQLVQRTYRNYFQVSVDGTVINPSSTISDIQSACGFSESDGTNQTIDIEWIDR